MTGEIQYNTPDTSHHKLLTLFEALKQLPTLTPMQMTAHEVALERCRLALEWQTAISEAAVLLFERTDVLLTNINTTARSTLAAPYGAPPTMNSDSWSAVVVEAKTLLQSTSEYREVSKKMHGCLLQLGAQVCDLEKLSAQLAELSEKVELSRRRISDGSR